MVLDPVEAGGEDGAGRVVARPAGREAPAGDHDLALQERLALTYPSQRLEENVRDLAEQRARWGEPVSTTYRGVTIYETPPPTQGLSVLQMLNLIEPVDLARLDRLGPAKEVAQVGAVIGGEFSYELLHAVDPIVEETDEYLRSLLVRQLLIASAITLSVAPPAIEMTVRIESRFAVALARERGG